MSITGPSETLLQIIGISKLEPSEWDAAVWNWDHPWSWRYITDDEDLLSYFQEQDITPISALGIDNLVFEHSVIKQSTLGAAAEVMRAYRYLQRKEEAEAANDNGVNTTRGLLIPRADMKLTFWMLLSNKFQKAVIGTGSHNSYVSCGLLAKYEEGKDYTWLTRERKVDFLVGTTKSLKLVKMRVQHAKSGVDVLFEFGVVARLDQWFLAGQDMIALCRPSVQVKSQEEILKKRRAERRSNMISFDTIFTVSDDT